MTKIQFRTRDEAQHENIKKFMNEKGLNQTEAMIKIVDKFFDTENRYAPLDDACPALTFTDDQWECTWGRIGQTPDTKKLGKSDEAMKNRCRACKKTLDMKDRLLTLEEKVARGFLDIPSCIYGGQLSDDGEKIYCKNPHMTSQHRDVKKWCKVVRNGANCEALRWSRVKIKGKLPDGQNL